METKAVERANAKGVDNLASRDGLGDIVFFGMGAVGETVCECQDRIISSSLVTKGVSRVVSIH